MKKKPTDIRHAIVLADPDPSRRARLQKQFATWYGDQFSVVPATGASDSALRWTP